MARPSKKRRVCGEPIPEPFIPAELAEHKDAEDSQIVTMTVDEYETIRLIDLENLSQEECAERMGVARTTVQAIYNTARRKTAECLVYRRELKIVGGNYFVCDGRASCSQCQKEEHPQETL